MLTKVVPETDKKLDEMKSKTATISLRTNQYNKYIIHQRAQDKGISDNAYLSEVLTREIKQPRSYEPLSMDIPMKGWDEYTPAEFDAMMAETRRKADNHEYSTANPMDDLAPVLKEEGIKLDK